MEIISLNNSKVLGNNITSNNESSNATKFLISHNTNFDERIGKLILKSTKIRKKSLLSTNLPRISPNSKYDQDSRQHHVLNTESLAQSEYSKWSSRPNTSDCVNEINYGSNKKSTLSPNRMSKGLRFKSIPRRNVSVNNSIPEQIDFDSIKNLKEVLHSIKNKSELLLSSPEDKFYSHLPVSSPSKQSSSDNSNLYTSIHEIPSNDIITMNSLKSAYEKELSSYDSMALFVEVRLRELLSNEDHNDEGPTKLKTAVCTDLLLKVVDSLGRHSNIIKPLLHEILKSIYVDYSPEKINKLSHLKNNIKRFYDMNTYFTELEKSKDYANDLSEELHMIHSGVKMTELVKKFKTFNIINDKARYYIRSCAFQSWKKYTKSRKIIHDRVNKQYLKSFWVRWLLFIMMTKGEINYARYTGINRRFLYGLLEKAVENSRALIERTLLIKIKASQTLTENDQGAMIDTHQNIEKLVPDIDETNAASNNVGKEKDHVVKSVNFNIN